MKGSARILMNMKWTLLCGSFLDSKIFPTKQNTFFFLNDPQKNKLFFQESVTKCGHVISSYWFLQQISRTFFTIDLIAAVSFLFLQTQSHFFGDGNQSIHLWDDKEFACIISALVDVTH